MNNNKEYINEEDKIIEEILTIYYNDPLVKKLYNKSKKPFIYE